MSGHAEYDAFIASKLRTPSSIAIVLDTEIHPSMFAYQRDIVRWALARGRAAIFADCGMGKTIMQLVWAREVAQRTGLPVLVVCPLAVAFQTVAESARFGIDAAYSRDGSIGSAIVVTNYDRFEKFDLASFGGLVLDESSILKSYDGKFRTAVISQAQSVPFRLACTATPAPNDHMELGNHAQFCGIMSREEMLASFFVHDLGGGTDEWRIKGHARQAFWRWVTSWAVCIRTPSDIGHSDDGFRMPTLNVHTDVISTSHLSADGTLFRMGALTLSELRAESKLTAPERVSRVADRVNATPGTWVVWCHTNDESARLTAAIDGAIEVRGDDDSDEKAAAMLAFSRGETRVIVTKPSIAGFGMNWQHCHQVAFVGLSHSYEQFYQAVRRCWRFGQTHDVEVHVTIADTEQSVLRAIQTKQAAADEMAKEMRDAMRTGTLDGAAAATWTTDDYSTHHASGEGWDLHNGDCVDVFRGLDSDSIGMSVFSPPFASLFTYSNSPRDMGNATSGDEFAAHFGFLIDELFRATIPGRICAVHCMQLPTSKARDGFIGIRDFRGEIIRMFSDRGWVYHSEVTIWKDPVVAMQRTKAHGLLYKTLCSDSSKSRQGLADYLVVFRKPGEASPVHRGVHRFDSYIGEEPPTASPDIDPRRYAIDVWQRYASPVWFDIDQTRTLNYREAREEDDEKHICPLQLDVVERAIELWSNPGDLVATPFAGIGTELVCALKMGRRAVGAELKAAYFDTAVRNIAAAIAPDHQLSLV